MELEAAQEWSYYPRKKTRGTLEDRGSHFFLSLDIGKTATNSHDNLQHFDELKGKSLTQDISFKLLHPVSSGSSSSMNRSGSFATYHYRSYTLLQSRSPLTSQKFKEFHVRPTGKLIELRDADIHYEKDRIVIDAPHITRTLYKTPDLEVFIETWFTSSSNTDTGIIVKQSDTIVLKYKKNQPIDTLLADFSKVRNLLMLTSYFGNDYNDVSMELWPVERGRTINNVVRLSSKNYRKVTVESENRAIPPHSWLFDHFLENAEAISHNYFDLLDTTDLQTSIDYYTAMFLPAKQNGVIEQRFMYSVLLIESLYERFIENFDDETKKHRDKLSRCKQCNREFCESCAPIRRVSLDTKLRRVVQKYVAGTKSEHYFRDLDYEKIAATRNYVAHVKIANKQKILSYGDMLDTASIFEYLFVYAILSSIGFTHEQLDKSLPLFNDFYALKRRHTTA